MRYIYNMDTIKSNWIIDPTYIIFSVLLLISTRVANYSVQQRRKRAFEILALICTRDEL